MSSTIAFKRILKNILSAPMIMETGTEGIWKWRKWSDGTVECWGRTAVKTYTFTTASGKGYYTYDDFSLPTDLFLTADYVLSARAQGTGSTPSNTLISINCRNLDTTAVSVWINSASSGSQSLSISLHVKGIWDNSIIDIGQHKPLYFELDDSSSYSYPSADIGFKKVDKAFRDIGGDPEPPEIDYTQFANYQAPTFQYSYDNQVWNDYTLGTTISLSSLSHKIVYFRGDNLAPWFDTYNVTNTRTVDETEKTYTHNFNIWTQVFMDNVIGKVKVGGNIMSLRYKDFKNKRTLPCDNAFRGLFMECKAIISAPVLPATTLTQSCYGNMFYNCTSLVAAPKLPATTLTPYCYAGMFSSCTALKVAPELPATTLSYNCYGTIRRPDVNPVDLFLAGSSDYEGMFNSCTSLTTAPNLPATTLADYCYRYMFRSCTSLTTAPQLSATTLAEYCCSFMFNKCTSLTIAPQLSATTLADYCYYNMFNSCTSLTTAPQLPATTLADYCYCSMFNKCTSLTTAPRLPATTLESACYYSMFSDCTSLTTTPELSATTLADSCYAEMFNSCVSLTTAPNLPATTLATSCYSSMFAYCISLIQTPRLPATTLATNCYSSMFSGCTGLTAISTLPTTDFGTNWGCYYHMFYKAVKADASNVSPCTNSYRIPTSGTSSGSYITTEPKIGQTVIDSMFANIDGTSSYTPPVDTVFYISVPSF